MVAKNEIKNIFSEESSSIDVFLELLGENFEYTDYIRNVIDDVLLEGGDKNE